MSAKYESPGHTYVPHAGKDINELDYRLPAVDYIGGQMVQLIEQFPQDQMLAEVTETVQHLPSDVLVPCMFGIAQKPEGELDSFFYLKQLNGNGDVTD